MPITQERMLNLLAEAEAYCHELLWLRDRLNVLLKQTDEDPGKLYELRNDIEFSLMQQQIPPASAMAVERYHFTRNKRRNERAKMRETHKRMESKGMVAPSGKVKPHPSQWSGATSSGPRPAAGIIPPRFSQQELDAMDPVDPTNIGMNGKTDPSDES